MNMSYLALLVASVTACERTVRSSISVSLYVSWVNHKSPQGYNILRMIGKDLSNGYRSLATGYGVAGLGCGLRLDDVDLRHGERVKGALRFGGATQKALIFWKAGYRDKRATQGNSFFINTGDSPLTYRALNQMVRWGVILG